MGPADQTDISFPPISSQTLSLPKLEADGSNWVLYKARMLSTLTYRRIIHYVDGRAKKPEQPPAHAPNSAKEKYKSNLETWEIGNEHA